MADYRTHPDAIAALPPGCTLVLDVEPFGPEEGYEPEMDTWVQQPGGSLLHIPNGVEDRIGMFVARAAEDALSRADREADR